MMNITLFGPTTVATDDATYGASDLGGVKPRQILEILAASAGAPIAKERLADLLWEGNPPKSYLGTLESYVCVLRRSLNLSAGRRSVLQTTSRGYLLDPEVVRVDLVDMRALLGRAAGADPAEAVRLTEDALGLVTRPLLASETYVAWAVAERDFVERELVAACTRAAGQAIEAGIVEAAVHLAGAALARDPFAEAAALHLMHAHWRSGQRCEALRVYGSLRSAMIEEFGMEPGGSTHEMYLRILRDEAHPSKGRAGRDRSELRLLLGLLRQALESMPGVELPRSDSALAAVAVQALEVA